MQRDTQAMASAAVGISIVGAGVAVSDQLTDYPVLSAQAIRYAIAAGLLVLIATASGRHEPPLPVRDWVRLLAVALTGMVLFNVAIVQAVTTGEPAVVGTIVGVAPVGLALLPPLVRRQRPTTAVVVGAVLAASGAALVQGFGAADLAAICWSLVALACEVAFTLLAAPLLRSLSPIGLSTRVCVAASVTMFVLAAVLDGSAAFARPDAGEVAAIGYLAVGSTAVAFVLWYGAVMHLGPERTGLFAGLMPISAAVVGAAVTAASLQLGTLAGALLTGAGLAVGLGFRSRPRPVADEDAVGAEAEPLVQVAGGPAMVLHGEGHPA